MKLDPMQGLSFPRAPQRSDTGVAAPVSSPGDDAHSRGAFSSTEQANRAHYDAKVARSNQTAGPVMWLLYTVLAAAMGVAVAAALGFLRFQ